ncbi:hypothetical protein TIFTF001_033983 [Ficus carica]|uniref:Uncharacterized protein n=1 Tax=Ficus carica TaxID=3494 RepID=A0AA88J4I4_FICCA|nr:hypothetical protein TIFTF001_033983 [Ficus carica]
MRVRVYQLFFSLGVGFRRQPLVCLWLPSPRDKGENHIVLVLTDVSLWQENGHCGKEQDINEIVDVGA